MKRLTNKAERLAARYIPEGAVKIAHPRGESVAVVYTSDKERNGRMYYSAIAYVGTAGHNSWHYSYSKPEHREAKIKELFEQCDRNDKWRAERRAQRKTETSPFSQPVTSEPIRLSTAATAAEVRATLKIAFPKTKFSVVSSEYSMGSSIDVRWTDGPTGKQVDAILDCFEGAGFDGMTDSKTYRGPSMWRGRRVIWGADYVHGSRSESAITLKVAAQQVAAGCGLPVLEVDESQGYPRVTGGGAGVPWCTYVKDDGTLGFSHNSHRDEQHEQLVYQYARSISLEDTQPHEVPQREPKPEPKPRPAREVQPGDPEYLAILAKIDELLRRDARARVVN
jgi:hypothetical protein